jgi:hypothetical protein
VDIRLLAAQIIQGEAGVIGDDGMKAVAAVLAGDLHIGLTAESIAGRWMGRAEPSPRAEELAAAVVAGTVSPSRFRYVMSQQDVWHKGWTNGDAVIRKSPKLALHLYKKWPQASGFTKWLEERGKFWRDGR